MLQHGKLDLRLLLVLYLLNIYIMSVQINIKKIPKLWKPGIYSKQDLVIFEDNLYILNDKFTSLYTSRDFELEFLDNDWLKKT